jgi:hypothetical protein
MLTDLTDLIDRLLTNLFDLTKIIHQLHSDKIRLTDLTTYRTNTHPYIDNLIQM